MDGIIEHECKSCRLLAKSAGLAEFTQMCNRARPTASIFSRISEPVRPVAMGLFIGYWRSNWLSDLESVINILCFQGQTGTSLS